MPQPLTPDEIDRLARKRAGAKLGWYVHATVYVLVNLMIFGMSQYAFGSRPLSSALPLAVTTVVVPYWPAGTGSDANAAETSLKNSITWMETLAPLSVFSAAVWPSLSE